MAVAKTSVDDGLPEIRINDRMAIFGQTGTGKSILAHHFFKTIPIAYPDENGEGGFWRIAIDPTDSIFDDSLTFADAENIPWNESPSLRFVPSVENMENEVDALYLSIMQHGYVWVWLDEANEISTSHKTVIGLRKVLLQGRKFQIGHAGVTPRPVDITKSLITQSEHIFIFPLADLDDRQRLAKNAGINILQFDEDMANLEEYGYLWYSVRDRMLFSMPPLPIEYVETLEG
jgi:hypothetical protein